MTVPEQSSIFAELRQRLAENEDYFTAVEAHGLLCAMAVLPALPDDWPHIAAGEAERLPDDLCRLLEAERQRLASRLGAGEHIQLPCRLDPFEDNEGADLAAWCTGFMAGILAAGPEGDEELDPLLLPFLLFSGLDEDPELDALWRDEKLVRQMARSLPDLLEELFLRLQAPELKD